MLVFSLAGAPLSISQDATRTVNLLYCRSPRKQLTEDEMAEDSTACHVNCSIKQFPITGPKLDENRRKQGRMRHFKRLYTGNE